jgi:hypothetical protein
MARVINVKKHCLWDEYRYLSLEEWLSADTKHVYIGRDMTRYIPGAYKSKWANPFPLHYSREESLEMYENYIRHSYHLWNSIFELDGCILGCWCAPSPCHGHILQKILNERKIEYTR